MKLILTLMALCSSPIPVKTNNYEIPVNALNEIKKIEPLLKSNQKVNISIKYYSKGEKNPHFYIRSISVEREFLDTQSLPDVYVFEVSPPRQKGEKGGSSYYYCAARTGGILGVIKTK